MIKKFIHNEIVLKILILPRSQKRALVFASDIFLCLISVVISYYLRVGIWVWPSGILWIPYFAAIIIAIPIFIIFGLYHSIFRYAGWGALMVLLRACFVQGLIYVTIFTSIGVVGIPRTIGIIQPVILMLLVGASRVFARIWLGARHGSSEKISNLPRALIYGAGEAGRQLAAAMVNNHEMNIVGFIDDDMALHGNYLNNKKIYGPNNLIKIVDDLNVSNILLAIPSVSRKRRHEIITLLSKTSAIITTLPGINDLAQGRIKVNDLRDVNISDLLNRKEVDPDLNLLTKNITNKIVLVTGSGGSIGSELCRKILSQNPTTLLLIEISEYALYLIHRELEQQLSATPGLDTHLIPLLCSVTDEVRMRSIMSTWAPQTVYHAAAYKHVPLVEHNPAEGVRNNVFGTLTAAKLAEEFGVENFVLISTDKAVRPTNVMGASKRFAEMVLQAFADKGSATCYSMVRFGNVLGSSGSVVPLFRQQIIAGGPITITHPEITRYFMTIPEAALLVIQAGSLATGGEVFVLDMGEPVKIIDLAKNMIESSGLTLHDQENPDGDIEIKIIGLRPGEKLYEELLIGDNPTPTTHPRIMKATDAFMPWSQLQFQLNHVKTMIEHNDVLGVRAKLKELVIGYVPDAEIVDWAHLKQANG
jgi:FlaA1/EpsC-like NDP-sugar epimerase